MRRGWIISVLVLSALIIGVLLIPRRPDPQQDDAPAQQATGATRGTLAVSVGGDEEFASSHACAECHADQHDSWRHSFHRTMTQVARPSSVAAPSGRHVLQSRGREFVITRTDDDFTVEMPDPEWERQLQAQGVPLAEITNPRRVKRQIVMTTGSHHYQAYWIHGSAGADLHQVPFIYHLEEHRWIPKEDSFLHPPSDQAEFAVWNANCIQCHSVAGEPRLDRRTNRFASRVVELGIACEACHGPSREHVRLARAASRAGAVSARDLHGEMVNPLVLTQQRSGEVCGQCHGYFVPHNPAEWWVSGWRNQYHAGEELEATRTLVRHVRSPAATSQGQSIQAADSLYWPDGTVRVGGREYLGMIESGCYQRGELTCLSCHSMHRYANRDDQMAPGMRSNQACLQCHQTMAGELEQHTHHSAESSGSQCYNCHMPHTSYALFKAIRSHRIDSPAAAVTRDTGRPNACNLCHLDQTLAWTADHLHEWYSQPNVEFDRSHRTVSATILNLLQGDAAQRSVAVWATGWPPARETSGTTWMPAYLAQLMQDPYPVIRLMAWRSLRTLPDYQDIAYDFLADTRNRTAAVDEILRRWKAQPATDLEAADAVLLNSDGSLRQAEFAERLTTRDDRPISISE